MNQGNFQNIGGPRPVQQGVPQPGGMQRNGGTSSDIRPQIMALVSGQPVPPGWQTVINPQQRTVIIHQL